MDQNIKGKEEKSSIVESSVEKSVDSSSKASACIQQDRASAEAPHKKQVTEPLNVSQMNGNGLAASPEGPTTKSCDITSSSAHVERDQIKSVASTSLSSCDNKTPSQSITNAVKEPDFKSGITERPASLGNLRPSSSCSEPPHVKVVLEKRNDVKKAASTSISASAAESKPEHSAAGTNGGKQDSKVEKQTTKNNADTIPKQETVVVNGVVSPECAATKPETQQKTPVGNKPKEPVPDKEPVLVNGVVTPAEAKEVAKDSVEAVVKEDAPPPEKVCENVGNIVTEINEKSLDHAATEELKTEPARTDEKVAENKNQDVASIIKETHSNDEKLQSLPETAHSSATETKVSLSREKESPSAKAESDKPSPVIASPKNETISTSPVNEVKTVESDKTEVTNKEVEVPSVSQIETKVQENKVKTVESDKTDKTDVPNKEHEVPSIPQIEEDRVEAVEQVPEVTDEKTSDVTTQELQKETMEGVKDEKEICEEVAVEKATDKQEEAAERSDPVDVDKTPSGEEEKCHEAAGDVVSHVEHEVGAATTHPSAAVDQPKEVKQENIASVPPSEAISDAVKSTRDEQDATADDDKQPQEIHSNATEEVKVTDEIIQDSQQDTAVPQDNIDNAESQQTDVGEEGSNKIETEEPVLETEVAKADESQQIAASEEVKKDEVESEDKADQPQDTEIPQENADSVPDQKEEDKVVAQSPKMSGARTKVAPFRSPDKTRRILSKSYSEKDATDKKITSSANSRKPSSSDSSPRKTVKNGVTSPSKTSRTPSLEQRKLPPIKAPVGLAASPNVRAVKSKIGSMENIKHKPGGGEKKVLSKKLEWNASSKVGSLDNATHKPGGGDKKIATQKVDFKDKAQPKVGSKDMLKHQPGGGNVKIDVQKVDFKERASSKIGSLDNVTHKPGGGDVKIKTEKLNFNDTATSKIGSMPDSDQSSINQSPLPPSSPSRENSASPGNGESQEQAQMNGIPDELASSKKQTPQEIPVAAETHGDASKC